MRRDAWVAERNGLLNRRTSNIVPPRGLLAAGSNPALSAIFFAFFPIYPEKWKILTSAKTRLLKGFYNFSDRVHETHSESVERLILPE